MSEFQASTHNPSHNTVLWCVPNCPLCDGDNLSYDSRLETYAPEGTRTPNLLIRSQMSTPTDAPSTYEIRTEAAIEIPKADKRSLDNSHNISGAVSFLSEGPR